jgi:hypothetical protein
MSVIALAQISKAVVGLADLIGRIAKNIEQTIKSGVRSGDVVRRERERRRFRNFMMLTAHLYVEQVEFISALSEFCEDPSVRGTWEQAKFELLTITRLLGQIEEFVLPANDALLTKYRKEYLEILTSLRARKKLLEFVYELEYEDAVANLKELKKLSAAYRKLAAELRDISLKLGELSLEDDSLQLGPAQRPETLKGSTKPKKKADVAKRKGAKKSAA